MEMMRTLAVVALLAGALLAGCSSPSEDTQSETGPSFDDLGLQATSTTGLIRGVVVDDAIRPIAGAKISLLGDAPKEAVTSDEGTFGFDGLPAATYFLKVNKLGYREAQHSVDVVAGVAEPPSAKVLLAADPSNMPYVEDYVYEGFVECTTAVFVACGAVNLLTEQNVTNDRFTWDQYVSDGATMIQSEMMWTSTQAVSPQLYFEMEALNGECPELDENDNFLNSTRGDSPIMARITAEQIQTYSIGSACPIYYSLFSGGPVCTPPTPVPEVGTLNPICPGVTFEQRFTMYIHAFHGYLPPDDWRFSSGEPVPQPQ